MDSRPFRTRPADWLLVPAAVLFCLALLEIYLRLHPPPFVYMVTRHVLQQTHCELSPDPELGYVPRAGFSGPFNNREFHTRVTLNSKRMRDREYPEPKPEGITRVAFMGDSFAMGWGVEQQEMASEILEERFLKNTEVLNFGVSGYDDNQVLEWLKTQAIPFHPDVVIFPANGFLEKTLPEKLRMENGLLYEASAGPRTLWVKTRVWLYKNLYTISFFDFVRTNARGWLRQMLRPPAPDTPWQLPPGKEKAAREILRNLKKLGEENRFAPVVMRFPLKEALLGKSSGDDPVMARTLERLSKEEGVGYLDLKDALEGTWKSTGRFPYFGLDDHWNRDGHAVAARSLARYLRENALLPADKFQRED